MRRGGAVRELRAGETSGETVTVRLDYRPPFDWAALLGFLAARAIPGVESVEDGVYLRTAAVGAAPGVAVGRGRSRSGTPGACARDLALARGRADAARGAAAAALRSRRAPRGHRRAPRPRSRASPDPCARAPRPARAGRLRRLRDRGARRARPAGLACAPAATIAARLATAAGRAGRDAVPGVDPPVPARRAPRRRDGARSAALGMPGARARTVIALARAVSRGELSLDVAGEPAQPVEQLEALPGVGPWTAHYLAMRASAGPTPSPRTISSCARRSADLGRARRGPRGALAPLARLRRHASLDRARDPAGRRAGHPTSNATPDFLQEQVSHEHPNLLRDHVEPRRRR